MATSHGWPFFVCATHAPCAAFRLSNGHWGGIVPMDRRFIVEYHSLRVHSSFMIADENGKVMHCAAWCAIRHLARGAADDLVIDLRVADVRTVGVLRAINHSLALS